MIRKLGVSNIISLKLGLEIVESYHIVPTNEKNVGHARPKEGGTNQCSDKGLSYFYGIENK